MAYIIPNVTPLDVATKVAIGINIPFNSPTSVFTQTYTTLDQIKANLINYVLTNRGERPLNPSFGLNLREKIFDNITPVSTSDLQSFITQGISINFPYLSDINSTVTPHHDTNTVNITVKYTYLGNIDTFNIQL